MSTISSASANQLSSTSSIADTLVTTSGASAASSGTKTKAVTTDTSALTSANVSKPQLEEILGVLKKVLEAVASLLQLFGKDKAGTAGTGTGTGTGTNSPAKGSHSNGASGCGTSSRSAAVTGSTLNGSGEFLWKPQSDKDSKLAILLPSSLEGKVDSVSVVTPNGDSVKGENAGVGNGGREHFRFSKAGGEFPDGSTVLIQLRDGTTNRVSIADSSARNQR